MIRYMLRLSCFAIGLLGLLGVVGFGGERGKVGAANATIEQSLGATLSRPVFQCGTGSDSVTDDVIAARRNGV